MRVFTCKSGGAICAVSVAALILSGCATTAPVTQPELDYVSAADCTETLAFDAPIRAASDKKSIKRYNRARTIVLSADMASTEVGCLNTSGVRDRPYAVYEIPTGLRGRVVTAGAQLDTAVIFAADVETYDAQGNLVRRFDAEDYQRRGSLFGVQFAPRETETYVVIQADPRKVGDASSTVELGAQQVYVSSYNGLYGGNNTVGRQNTFDRTFAYNGLTGIRVVFPKQDEE